MAIRSCQSPRPNHRIHGSYRKILILAASPNLAHLMKEHLHHHDHAHVNTASTPPQALALFAQFHHDVVITDMILPGGKEKLNGLEFLEQIRIMDPSTFRVIMSFAGSTSLVPFGAANAQLEDGHGHTIEGLHLLLRHPRLGLSIPPLLESAHH